MRPRPFRPSGVQHRHARTRAPYPTGFGARVRTASLCGVASSFPEASAPAVPPRLGSGRFRRRDGLGRSLLGRLALLLLARDVLLALLLRVLRGLFGAQG